MACLELHGIALQCNLRVACEQGHCGYATAMRGRPDTQDPCAKGRLVARRRAVVPPGFPHELRTVRLLCKTILPLDFFEKKSVEFAYSSHGKRGGWERYETPPLQRAICASGWPFLLAAQCMRTRRERGDAP